MPRLHNATWMRMWENQMKGPLKGDVSLLD